MGLIDDADLNPATASTINTAPEGNADRTAWLYNRIGPAAGINWHELITTVTPPGGGGNPAAGQNCVFWDFINNVWLVPFIDGNFPTVDGGVIASNSGLDENNDTWFQFGGGAGPTFGAFGGVDFPADMCFTPGSTTQYLVAIVSPGANRSKIVSLTTSSGPTSVLAFGGTTTIQSCMMRSFGGAAVAGFGATDAANTRIWYSTDGVTWNSVTVGTTIGSGCELLVKSGPFSSGSRWIVIPEIAATAETGTQFAYWTSVDGTTWVQRSLSGVIGSGEVPSGLAFGNDQVGPCWILVTVAGTTQSNFYRSTDGIAWSFIASTTTRVVVDLVCLDTMWAAAVVDASTSSPPGGIWGTPPATVYASAGATYVIVSTNGAHNWFRTQATLTKNLTSTGRQQLPRFVSSNQQLCLFNSLQLRFSNVIVPNVPFT